MNKIATKYTLHVENMMTGSKHPEDMYSYTDALSRFNSLSAAGGGHQYSLTLVDASGDVLQNYEPQGTTTLASLFALDKVYDIHYEDPDSFEHDSFIGSFNSYDAEAHYKRVSGSGNAHYYRYVEHGSGDEITPPSEDTKCVGVEAAPANYLTLKDGEVVEITLPEGTVILVNADGTMKFDTKGIIRDPDSRG